MDADIKSFLTSWSDEIEAKKNRVRQLIGDAHWLSDGHYKEYILRDFFLRHLPRYLNISRGFVKTTRDLTLTSPEVDILISDPRLNPPFFLEDDLQIVDASTVIAQVEVKTTFSKGTLVHALLNVFHTQAIVGEQQAPDSIWKGICFFSGDSDRNIQSILDTTVDAIKEAVKQEEKKGAIDNIFFPTCIASLERYCLFLHRESTRKLSIKLFDLGHLSFPCAFADMFSAMRRRSGGVVLGGLDNVIDKIHIENSLTQDIAL